MSEKIRRMPVERVKEGDSLHIGAGVSQEVASVRKDESDSHYVIVELANAVTLRFPRGVNVGILHTDTPDTTDRRARRKLAHGSKIPPRFPRQQ